MGEAFASATPATIQAKIMGTGDLLQVDVFRNGEVVQTLKPERADFEFAYTDPVTASGEVYYYVRVIQKSGDMAWGSPIWVKYP